MNTLVSFASEIEDAVASGDAGRRIEALRRTTDLFASQAAHLAESHVEVFDEVILRLARDIEFRARVELAERMADIANAPRRVIGTLARDEDIAVAGPVIERSARLDDDDLVAIAKDRGQDHLFALSRRSTLSEKVTDILVDRGDHQVVRSVAGNSGARFSEQGFTQLLERAREDSTLQRIVRDRCDIPPRHMSRLVEIAREKARESLLLDIEGDDSEMMDAALDDVSSLLAQGGAGVKALTGDFQEAAAYVARQAVSQPLDEEMVAAWLKQGRIEEALAAIAQMANVPVQMVARAYHSSHYDPLLFLLRSQRFGWATFKLMITCKAGRLPPQDVLRSAFEGFQRLSVATAQRVVRFTAARERAGQSAA